MRLRSIELDEFVVECDRRGGPGHPDCHEYWKKFEYQRNIDVNKALDPFSDKYFSQQVALYGEISGRNLNQFENEHTIFNVIRHAAARNPYDHGDPAALAGHLLRLHTAFRLAALPRGGNLLDMGCGWGLSSEAAAYLGLNVTAVDINEDFVQLVQTRSKRLDLSIVAEKSSFDTFTSAIEFDGVLFYECLHHATRPWDVVARMASMMKDGGKLMLCGEPINEFWWPNWGLRLDPLSVYCIRKHGWFESGWSLAFILECLQRAQFLCDVTQSPDQDIGTVIVATKRGQERDLLSADWLARNASLAGAALDGKFLVVGAEAAITMKSPIKLPEPKLVAHNYRPSKVSVWIRVDDGEFRRAELIKGESKLPLIGFAPGSTLSIRSETWVPAQEIGNSDQRELGFHILGLEVGR